MGRLKLQLSLQQEIVQVRKKADNEFRYPKEILLFMDWWTTDAVDSYVINRVDVFGKRFFRQCDHRLNKKLMLG